MTVHGKAAHAGLDFTSGASAIVELARQIEIISQFTDLDRELTVNPGVIKGGTRSNVVADFAERPCRLSHCSRQGCRWLRAQISQAEADR